MSVKLITYVPKVRNVIIPIGMANIIDPFTLIPKWSEMSKFIKMKDIFGHFGIRVNGSVILVLGAHGIFNF